MSAGRYRPGRSTLHGPKPTKLPDVRSEINVTPLVDVCLVLLIIFLVIAPEMERGREVALPKTKHHIEKKDTGKQPIVSVSLEGGRPRIWFDRTLMTDEAQLKAVLSDHLRRHPEGVFFKGDSDLKFGQVYPVLMAIHQAGTEGVELGTNELKENR